MKLLASDAVSLGPRCPACRRRSLSEGCALFCPRAFVIELLEQLTELAEQRKDRGMKAVCVLPAYETRRRRPMDAFAGDARRIPSRATSRRLRAVYLAHRTDAVCEDCGHRFPGREAMPTFCRWCRARAVELGSVDPLQEHLPIELLRSGPTPARVEPEKRRQTIGAQRAQQLEFPAVEADRPSTSSRSVEIANMNDQIKEQLSKDVTAAGVLLEALPEGDQLVGYQCTLIVRRGATGQLDAVHAAVAAEDAKADVGAAIRDRTVESWGAL